MAFLAQIRLDEVATAHPEPPLPAAGLLLVFAAIEADGTYPMDERAARAILVDPKNLSGTATWPEALDPTLRYRGVAVEGDVITSLPGPLSFWAETEADAEQQEVIDAATAVPPPHHRMFGHPVRIQDRLPPGDDDEPDVLLLQIDTDSSTGMMFGDGGSLQFWVPAPELAKGDLSHRIVELDCY